MADTTDTVHATALGGLPPPTDLTGAAVRAANPAVALVFAVNGFAFASWLARVPQASVLLDLSAGRLGILLLALSVGAVLALPLSGTVVRALRPAGAVRAGALLVALGLVLAAVGAQTLGAPVVTGVGLFLIGAGSGTWDVAMNVEGAAVEQGLGRTVMPRYHAAFSVGTVLGALLGALAVHLDLSLVWHLGGAALVAALVPLVVVRRFLPPVLPEEAAATHGSPWAAWGQRRTLAIGVLVLCAAFVEGIANDWLALGVNDGYDAAQSTGVLVFATFLAAMTAGRLAVGPLMDRRGRPAVIAASFGLVVVGVLVVVLGPAVWSSFIGAVAWGLGSAVGFPAGMSAAAESGSAQESAAHVSVVATIGYTAFLGGPPLLGFLGDEIGVHHALAVVAVVALGGLAVSRAARPPQQT